MKRHDLSLSRLSFMTRNIERARGFPRQSQNRLPQASPIFFGRCAPLTPPPHARSFSFALVLTSREKIVSASAIVLALLFPLGGATAQSPQHQTVRLTETTIPLNDARNELANAWKDELPAVRALQAQSIKIGVETGIKPTALGAHFWIATFSDGRDKITLSILNGPGCQFSNGPSTPLSSCPARILTFRKGQIVHNRKLPDFAFVAEVTRTDFTSVTLDATRRTLITNVTIDGLAQREPLSTMPLQ
jgi:hypothetical protein